MLETYLRNIRFWLPAGPESEDILREIREDLESKIDGRSPSDAELEEILLERGEPSFVASQYGQHPPLIGPRLIPAYWFVLRLVTLRIVLPVQIFIVAPVKWATLSHGGETGLIPFLLEHAWSATTAVMMAASIITLVFAVMERTEFRFNRNWHPSKLPNLPAPIGDPVIPRSRLASELVAGVVAAWFWVAVIQSPAMRSFNFNGVIVAMTAGWQMYLWPLLLLTLSSVLLNWFRLAWPTRIDHARWLGMALNAANAAVMGMLLMQAGPWIESNVSSVAGWANLGIAITLALTAATHLFNIAGTVWRSRMIMRAS